MAETASFPPVDGHPRVVIGISGPARRSITHRLIQLGLHLCGADTRYIRPGSTVEPWQLDGLVLSGGTHIHPDRYGQQPEVIARYDQQRDETDWELMELAHRTSLPVLGICRGAQFINIYRAGTLCQDVTPLRVHTRHRPLLLPMQTVRVVRGSRLATALGAHNLGANRIHSQAIKRLGRQLQAVALDNDGFVQGIEHRGQHWLLGVQWHPEYLLYHPLHRRLFRQLVAAAQTFRNERTQKSRV
ncbi:MAG: gamma-glutamyl-gamma-aminobutyrate hydrolase family protein [Marinobacter sp.]|nr:gamma-glutamyl-gamma-aminobutyrate hydrolase family protein [Marinobacter sp.]